MTGLGEIAREMLFRGGSAISKADVVTVVLLVGTSHLMVSVSVSIQNTTDEVNMQARC